VFTGDAQKIQPTIPVAHLDPGTIGQPGFQFAGGVPAVVNLIPHGDGARKGHLWIGNTGRSIRIVGEVDGEIPDWPNDPTSILSKEHVEVWLASADPPEMPPIGWGEQKLNGENGCLGIRSTTTEHSDAVAQQNCRHWFKKQREYRLLVWRLFIRHWLLAGNFAVEAYATPAYKIISTKYAGDKSGRNRTERKNRISFGTEAWETWVHFRG